jgi:hypothetical protein
MGFNMDLFALEFPRLVGQPNVKIEVPWQEKAAIHARIPLVKHTRLWSGTRRGSGVSLLGCGELETPISNASLCMKIWDSDMFDRKPLFSLRSIHFVATC